MKRIEVISKVVAVACFLAILCGCGGSGGSSTQPPGTFHIYVGDSANGRIVRLDNMAGDGWSAKTGTEGGGAAFTGSNVLDSAFDSQGRMYVVDYNNSRIVRFDSFDTTVQTSFGTNGSGVNQFDGPTRIAFDSQDRIYICDYNNNRLVRIDDMTGAGWTTFGSSGSGTNQFSGLYGIDLDNQGRIYIADAFNDRIVRIDDMSGTNWTTFGSNGNGVGQLDGPLSIRIYQGNKMLIADKWNGRVVLTDLMSATGWQTFPQSTVNAVSIDSQDRIYTVNDNDFKVKRYNSMSDPSPVSFGVPGSGTGQFNDPSGVMIGP